MILFSVSCSGKDCLFRQFILDLNLIVTKWTTLQKMTRGSHIMDPKTSRRDLSILRRKVT
jgi:hypothetical protein